MLAITLTLVLILIVIIFMTLDLNHWELSVEREAVRNTTMLRALA